MIFDFKLPYKKSLPTAGIIVKLKLSSWPLSEGYLPELQAFGGVRKAASATCAARCNTKAPSISQLVRSDTWPRCCLKVQ